MVNARTESSGSENVEQLSRGRRFELLSDQRRRRVVGHLQEVSVPVALADLAKQIAERESATTTAAAADQDRRTAVHRSLYHHHIPKLAEFGVVVHDRERGTVEPGANFECVAELYDAIPAVDGPGPE